MKYVVNHLNSLLKLWIPVQIRTLIWYGIASRLIIFFTVYMARSLLYVNTDVMMVSFVYHPTNNALIDGLSTWDGQWYIYLSEHGYLQSLHGIHNLMKYVFYPLYPALIHVLTFSIIPSGVVGILLNLILFFASLVLLYRYISSLNSENDVAFLSAKYFALSYAAVFFSMVYTETLFMFLSLVFLWFLQRKKYLYSAFAGALAIWSRAQGLCLFIPYIAIGIYAGLKTKKVSIKWGVGLGIMMSAVIAFAIWMQFNSGQNYTQSLRSMLLFKRLPNYWLNPVFLVYENIRHFTTIPLHGYDTSKIDFIFLCLSVIVTLLTNRRVKLPLSLYGLSIIILPLLSGKTTSYLRYLSISVPFYYGLGILASKYKFLDPLITVIFVGLSCIFTLLIANWNWVA